jgi:hypothetical protein
MYHVQHLDQLIAHGYPATVAVAAVAVVMSVEPQRIQLIVLKVCHSQNTKCLACSSTVTESFVNRTITA